MGVGGANNFDRNCGSRPMQYVSKRYFKNEKGVIL